MPCRSREQQEQKQRLARFRRGEPVATRQITDKKLRGVLQYKEKLTQDATLRGCQGRRVAAAGRAWRNGGRGVGKDLALQTGALIVPIMYLAACMSVQTASSAAVLIS